jgi:hypothetical protein
LTWFEGGVRIKHELKIRIKKRKIVYVN